MQSLRGIGIGSIAFGTAVHFRNSAADSRNYAGPKQEKEQYEKRVGLAKSKLEELIRRTDQKETREILAAQVQMVEDVTLKKSVYEKIDSGIPFERATREACREIADLFSAMKDEYMRNRASDFLMLSGLIASDKPEPELPENAILLSDDLSPYDTARLDFSRIRGLALSGSSATSHTAILARARGLTAVLAVGSGLAQVRDGTPLCIDGTSGVLYVDPDPETAARMKDSSRREAEMREKILCEQAQPSVLKSGEPFSLFCNLSDPKALSEKALKAEGCGLFRSEFLYMGRATVPNEEEQFLLYRSVLEAFGGKPVTIRTLDAGGDKEVPCLDMPKEANPFLGCRAIRFCLRHTDLFKTQLRALLRASVYGKLKIMFPMIAKEEELDQSLLLVDQCRRELKNEGTPFDGQVPIGMMIEIPAAALCADRLSRKVDFFSVGTNDLCQYTFAADRQNSLVSGLSGGLSTALIRLLRFAADSAAAAGIEISVCGELAADPVSAVVFRGLGISRLSMNPASIPKVKAALRAVTLQQAKEAADALSNCADAVKEERRLKEWLQGLIR